MPIIYMQMVKNLQLLVSKDNRNIRANPRISKTNNIEKIRRHTADLADCNVLLYVHAILHCPNYRAIVRKKIPSRH